MKVFFTDKLVLLLVLAPIPFWVITAGVDSGTQSPVINQILILAILYPMLEETVFRGIIQPTIYNRLNGRLGLFSYANILTSILFSVFIVLPQIVYDSDKTQNTIENHFGLNSTFINSNLENQEVVIENDDVVFKFNTKGGSLAEIQLKDYVDYKGDDLFLIKNNRRLRMNNP